MKKTVDNVLWRLQSRQADVVCIQTKAGAIVEKRIVQAKSEAEANWINDVSRHFRQQLRELGVPLAEPYIFEIRDKLPIQTSPYIGLNLETIICEHQAPINLLSTLLRAIKGVLEQVNPDVGIDARLSNFCTDGTGNIYYVDTFPPLVKYEGNYIVHFPNPLDEETIKREVVRKFSVMGILRRMRFTILEQRNGIGEPELLLAIKEVMGKGFWQQVKDFFHTLPGHIELTDAMSKINVDDPDWIRELALSLAPDGVEGRAFVHRAFELSSNMTANDQPTLSADERLRQIHLLFNQRLL